jgi:plastocyanin
MKASTNIRLALCLPLLLSAAAPATRAADVPTAVSPTADASTADVPAADTVTIRNFMFSPTTLTVKAGATVTWNNKDKEPHTVVSDAGLFRSGAFDTDESFSFRFDKPGTYHFTCSIHPMMVGTVVVQ